MSIIFQNVSHVFSKKTPFEFEALKDVSLNIEKGSIVAIVGRTGSGKSTLIQHINALLRPTSGEVIADGFLNGPKNKLKGKKLKALRSRIGMVFQFPEYQLFEETVEKDVCFAPKNFGVSKEESIKRAHEALAMVGLDESFYKRSPFELSGGEKRKVAIAGILAAKPDILVLDEPTAGLDPAASIDTMDLFKKIHTEEGMDLILVTHDMNLVARYADRVIVVADGGIAFDGKPVDLFEKDLSIYSLDNPDVYKTYKELKAKGLGLPEKELNTVDDLAEAIKEALNNGR